MKSLVLCLSFIWIFIQVRVTFCQRFVGDFCSLSTGISGQCQLIKDCPSVLAGLSQGIYPQICGFQGADSIVCCAGSDPVSSSTTIKTTTSTRGTPATIATDKPKEPVVTGVGDKSRAKCKEYDQYSYEYVVAGAPPTFDCGIVEVPLIVGGENAKGKEFPHMALIGFPDANDQPVWQCGGSLISEQFILTAGHCLYSKQYGEPKYVKVGDLVINSNRDDADPQDFTISEVHRHPDYRPPSQYNDIALIKLNKKANLNPYVRPACLETNPVVDLRRKAIASGWGRTGFTSDASETLLKVTLEYFTHSECNTSYRNDVGRRLKFGIVDQTQICAGSHNQSKDTCQGDSGGPLQMVNVERDCMYTIVGVTSFGKACGVVNLPGVYTRVSNYIGWIEQIVWP